MLPQPLRLGLRRLLYQGGDVNCPLCGNTVRAFQTAGEAAAILERKQVAGGMIRYEDACPICHGAARTRLMMLYLRDVLNARETPLRVLHVAPEPGLYIWIQKWTKLDYLATDIDRRRYRHIPAFVENDIADIKLNSSTFDLVICSHVLEHVTDDKAAMSEILRMLKPGGQAMLMVPLAADGQDTDEDPSISDPAERRRRFGQWDHVRLYGREDFVARLRKTGFHVNYFNAADQSPPQLEALRLDPRETLIIAEASP